MNKSKIEWCDYTWNPIKGYCPNDCPYCYSHRIYNRFKWDKQLRCNFPELYKITKIKEPSRIFVGSMIDLYHPQIHKPWVEMIIDYSKRCPQHTFITLTKFPENLLIYSFPKNWWIGVTIDGNYSSSILDISLKTFVSDKNVRFISFEPILDSTVIHFSLINIDWIIIGGLTPKPVHKKEWIDDIVHRADKLNIPVFIKNNANYLIERKEFPV